MDELPYLVIKRLLEYSDIASRRICRAVCSRWRDEIDDNTGLSLIIDDREAGLLDFVNSVVIKELNIKFLSCEDEEWLDLCLDDVKTLIFTGYVVPKFLRTHLLSDGNKNWQYLNKLYFYGSTLISQPFCKPKKAVRPIHCTLPNLKEFHVVLTHGTYGQAMDQFLHGLEQKYFSLNPEPDTEQTLARILKDRAYSNALFLLRSITGPQLKNFFFSLGSELYFSHFEVLKFLEKHASLETVILPIFWIFDDDENILNPEQLIKREAYLQQSKLKTFMVSRFGPGIQTALWKDLLLAQSNLQDLFLRFDTLHIETYAQFLTSILTKNLQTLKFVTIYHYPNKDGTGLVELDLQVLENSPCLEVLRIMEQTIEKKRVFYAVPENGLCPCGNLCCQDEVKYTRATADPGVKQQLKNIHCLPKSIKVFQTTFATPEDFDGVRFMQEMVNMEELKMMSVRRVGIMQPVSQLMNFIRVSLRHRKLHVFEIEIGFTLDTVPDIGVGKYWWNGLRPLVMPSRDAATIYEVLSQLSNPDKAENMSRNYLLESLYLGGTHPEMIFKHDFELGVNIVDDESVHYHRNYFDVIDKGLTNSIGTSQPFNIDHSNAKSYAVTGTLDDERCWGAVRTPLRCITTSLMDYSTIYNKCAAGQGQCNVTVLQHEIQFQAQQLHLNLGKHLVAAQNEDEEWSEEHQMKSDEELAEQFKTLMNATLQTTMGGTGNQIPTAGEHLKTNENLDLEVTNHENAGENVPNYENDAMFNDPDFDYLTNSLALDLLKTFKALQLQQLKIEDEAGGMVNAADPVVLPESDADAVNQIPVALTEIPGMIESGEIEAPPAERVIFNRFKSFYLTPERKPEII